MTCCNEIIITLEKNSKTMKLTFLQSASVILESNGAKILCDPWLTNQVYYGSWAQYPPYDFKPEKFEDLDYIYISHAHPDHCESKTLSKLRKDTPVLIHDFPQKFLKRYIENFGYDVIELPHDMRTHLKNNVFINILAADDCDPTVCNRLFACNFDEKKYGTNQIDTMCVIDNGQEVVVNTNDCPFELAGQVSEKVKKNYKNIDLLLVGYAGASSYPQCYELEENQKKIAAEKKKNFRLSATISYINVFNPKYFMPFAGRYTPCGKNYVLNQYRGEPELEEAFEYLISHLDQTKNKGILLNPNTSFDTKSGKSSEIYQKINLRKKEEYVKNVLSTFKYDFEDEQKPSLKEIMDLIPAAYDNFETKRKEIGFESDCTVLLEIPEDKLISVSCTGKGYKVIPKDEIKNISKYSKYSMDMRLLKWVLEGPKKANWDNVEVGSHIMHTRNPEKYERGLHYCLCFFHN